MRVWTTSFDPDRLDELRRFAESVSTPMFRELPGCLGQVHAVRDDEWITQTYWESPSHIEFAVGSERYQEVVARIMAAGFLRGTPSTEIFEMVEYSPPAP